MPLNTFSDGQTADADEVNANFALCVLTDTARTISVSHTYSASQTFTGGWTAAAACSITAASATAFAVGRQGATDAALLVHSSTASQATGIQITGKAAASGAAIAAISSGTDENLTIDAKGSGTISLGGTSTGAITLSRATTASVTLAVTQRLGVGAGGVASGAAVQISGSAGTSSTSQYGIISQPTVSSAATTAAYGVYSQVVTTAAAYTVTDAYGIYIANPSKGAGSAITNAYGLYIEAPTAGATINRALNIAGGAIALGNGSSTLSFYGGTLTSQQTVTGSRGGNAALASLLTALATFGLIVDSSS